MSGIATLEARLDAIENLVCAMATVVLNRISPSDRERTLLNLYKTARGESAQGKRPMSDRERVAGTYLIMLLDRCQGLPTDPAGAASRQRPT